MLDSITFLLSYEIVGFGAFCSGFYVHITSLTSTHTQIHRNVLVACCTTTFLIC